MTTKTNFCQLTSYFRGKRLELILLSLILLLSVTTSAIASWPSAVKLTTDPKVDNFPQIAIENNNLHLIYKRTPTSSNNGSVYYRKKESSTSSWSAPVKIADNSSSHAIAAYQGKSYVVYEGKDSALYYKTNALGSWPSTAKRLTGLSQKSYLPSMSQQGGKLYLAFVRPVKGRGDHIYFKAKTSGAWSDSVALTNDNLYNEDPSVLAQGGKVHVVWVTYNTSTGANYIKYRRFVNGSWSKTQTVISTSSSSLFKPRIAVYNGVPYVVYAISGSGSNIGISYFSGGSWINKKVTGNSSSSLNWEMFPAIGIFNGKVGVVWTRFPGGFSSKSNIMYKSLSSLSSSWSSTLNLTPGTATSSEMNPEIVFDSSGKAHIVFTSNKNNNPNDIYYIKQP